jgi:hypothetical protein
MADRNKDTSEALNKVAEVLKRSDSLFADVVVEEIGKPISTITASPVEPVNTGGNGQKAVEVAIQELKATVPLSLTKKALVECFVYENWTRKVEKIEFGKLPENTQVFMRTKPFDTPIVERINGKLVAADLTPLPKDLEFDRADLFGLVYPQWLLRIGYMKVKPSMMQKITMFALIALVLCMFLGLFLIGAMVLGK